MMRHLGALTCAVLGALVFRGFLGAVIGALIGNAIDNARERTRRSRQTDGRGFVTPLFALLGAVAKSDGRVSEREIAVAEAMMQRLQLDAEERKVAIRAFDRGKQPGYQVSQAIAELKNWTRGYRDLAYPMLDVVADTALAEGQPTTAKLAVLKQLAWSLRISELELMAMLAMKGVSAQQQRGGTWQGSRGGEGPRSTPPPHASGSADPYAILGLTRDADNAAVKRAYRKLISEHHPDRLGNLPDDLRRRAEQRASDINLAYDRIKEMRGMK